MSLASVFGVYAAGAHAGGHGRALVAGAVGRPHQFHAGILAVVWPGLIALALPHLIAGGTVRSGLVQIVAVVRSRRVTDEKWLLGLSNLATIVAGRLLILFPSAGGLALMTVVGA